MDKETLKNKLKNILNSLIYFQKLYNLDIVNSLEFLIENHNFYDHIFEVADYKELDITVLGFLNLFKFLNNGICPEFYKSIKNYSEFTKTNLIYNWCYCYCINIIIISKIFDKKILNMKKNCFKTLRFLVPEQILYDHFQKPEFQDLMYLMDIISLLEYKEINPEKLNHKKLVEKTRIPGILGVYLSFNYEYETTEKFLEKLKF